MFQTKKNKKGFTLIELLAVIIILGVVLVIAVPSVINTINNSYQRTYEYNLKALQSAAKDYVVSNGIRIDNTEQKIINITQMVSGSFIKVVKDPETKETCDGFVTVTKTDNNYVYEPYLKCGTNYVSNNYDDISEYLPAITLLGSTPINIYIGDSYVDAGATAKDYYNVDITSKIVVTSNVSTSIPGTYNVIYSVIDDIGNEGTVTRIVNVIDNASPTITFDPTSITTYAKSRETIVKVSDTGGINESSLKYVWSTSTTQPSTALFTTVYINNQIISSPTNAGGIYYLWVMASDKTGNQRIKSSGAFYLDNVAPVITVTGSNPISISRGSIYSDAGATALDNHDGSVSVTATSNVDANKTGTYIVTYTAPDSCGNVGMATRVVNVVDTTAPVITLNGSNPTNMSVNGVYADAGATALDDVDGDVTSKIVTTGTVNPSLIGTYTITYTVVDIANNTATLTRTVNVIDSTAPTVAFGMNGDITYSRMRSTKVTVSDNAAVNTSSLKYLWNTSATAPTEATFVTTFTNAGTLATPAGVTGNYYLWILAKDTSGNTSIVRTNVFRLDNTIPVITRLGSSTVTVNKGSTYTDAGATANDNVYLNITSSIVVTGTVNTNIIGTYTITYNVSDPLGNAATPVVRTVNVVDVLAPVITMNGSNPTNINLGGIYTEAGATALDDVDGDVTSRITTTGTVNPSIVGSYTITYTVKDNANNTATLTRTVNVLDNVIPTVAFGTNGNSTYAKTRSTTVTVSDNIAVNASSLKYLWNTSTTAPTEATFTTTFTNAGTIASPAGVTGGYYLWILAKDNTGNTLIARTNVFNLDNTIPTISNINLNGYTAGTWTNGNVTITTTATDANSGIQKYQGSADNGANWGDIPNAWIINTDYNANVIIRVIDNAGNISASSSAYLVKRDATNPTITTAPTNHQMTTFTNWALSGGAYINGSNQLVLPSTGSAANSPYMPASGSYWAFSMSGLATNPSPYFTPNSGAYITSQYFDANYASAMSNNGYASNGYAPTFPTNATTSFSWDGWSGYGPNVYYVIISTYLDNNYASAPLTLSNFSFYSNGGMSNYSKIINVTASDANGIKTTKWLAGAKVVADFSGAGTVFTNWFEVLSNGTYTIYVEDNAGNKIAYQQVISDIDVVGPTAPTSVGMTYSNGTTNYTNNTWANQSVYMYSSISGSTDAISGVSKYQLSSDNITWYDYVYDYTNPLYGLTSQGTQYRYARAIDKMGNIGSTTTKTIKIDKSAPVITMNGSSSVTITVGSTYTDAGATATDAYSGVSGSVTSTGTVNPSVVGTYTITYNATDNAGNAATPVTRTVNVIQSSYTLGYTGGAQTFTAPYTGTYKLETWGAQGGGTTGGLGGYATGNKTLTAGQILYVYVGGQGGNPSMSYGGYNGGGAGAYNSCYGGGGATDIRTPQTYTSYTGITYGSYSQGINPTLSVGKYEAIIYGTNIGNAVINANSSTETAADISATYFGYTGVITESSATLMRVQFDVFTAGAINIGARKTVPGTHSVSKVDVSRIDDDRIIVAGGGGGQGYNGNPAGTGGGTGGGASGGLATSVSGNPATQSAPGTVSGITNFIPATVMMGGWYTYTYPPTDGGGGGGGYYGGVGGYYGSSTSLGGSGGSGYIGGVSSGSTSNGVRSGNGSVKITYLGP